MTLVILIHAVLFLVYWLTNLLFREAVNNFLFDTTGLQVDFLLIFMGFAGLMALWSAARLALRHEARKAGPAWLYLAVGIFFLVFFYGSFVLLFMKNPVQVPRLGQLIQYIRLLIDAAVLLFLAWNLTRWVKVDRTLKKILLPAVLLVLWLVPAFCTPGNVYRGTLPEKPRLVAHRGASTLAPENTLAAMQAAAALGIYGLETDINISAEGVLFLMHDSTLARTTDVMQVFPGRGDDPVEDFTWSELSQLDAGSWFAGGADFSGEPIPTLEALLQVVREYDLYFIYDLRIPPGGHPYADQALDLCLEEIQAAGITDHTWVLAGLDWIAQVRSVLPDAVLAAGLDYGGTLPSPESLVADGYRVVNSEYGLSNGAIHAYQEAGLWVNLWVVDEPWQYSRLWLAGADSVTTNNPQGLQALPLPLLAMPSGTYLLIWGLVGVVTALMYWWRTRR